MDRYPTKVPKGFGEWEAGLPARIAERMRVREFSVKSLSAKLTAEGHAVSRHRLGRIVASTTHLSLGDALGLGRILFDDARALFRASGVQ